MEYLRPGRLGKGPKLAPPTTILLLSLSVMEIGPLGRSIGIGSAAAHLGVEVDGQDGQREQPPLLDDPAEEGADDGDSNEDDIHVEAACERIAETGPADGVGAEGVLAAVVPHMQLASAGNEDTDSAADAVDDVEEEGAFVLLLLGCMERFPMTQCRLVGLDHLSHDSAPELASKPLISICLSRAVGTSSVLWSTNGSSRRCLTFQEAAWRCSPIDYRGARVVQ